MGRSPEQGNGMAEGHRRGWTGGKTGCPCFHGGGPGKGFCLRGTEAETLVNTNLNR